MKNHCPSYMIGKVCYLSVSLPINHNSCASSYSQSKYSYTPISTKYRNTALVHSATIKYDWQGTLTRVTVRRVTVYMI